MRKLKVAVFASICVRFLKCDTRVFENVVLLNRQCNENNLREKKKAMNSLSVFKWIYIISNDLVNIGTGSRCIEDKTTMLHRYNLK